MSEPAASRHGQDDWRSIGACRQEDPELFFPMAQGQGLVQLQQAKAICARCSVRVQCLEFAVQTVQDHGVWGGMSEEERRNLRRARRRRELRFLASGKPALRPDAGCGRERAGRDEVGAASAKATRRA
jgi:WhiB family transcriptional regulator, redox-sensing transcriptional regulator